MYARLRWGHVQYLGAEARRCGRHRQTMTRIIADALGQRCRIETPWLEFLPQNKIVHKIRSVRNEGKNLFTSFDNVHMTLFHEWGMPKQPLFQSLQWSHRQQIQLLHQLLLPQQHRRHLKMLWHLRFVRQQGHPWQVLDVGSEAIILII